MAGEFFDACERVYPHKAIDASLTDALPNHWR
jgi:hypothetical protein